MTDTVPGLEPQPIKIALIVTSTRTPQIGTHVGDYLHKTLLPATPPGTTLTLLRVTDFNLPLYDETVLPAMVPFKASFSHAHSIVWSAAIAPFSAYIFVLPEYNYGIAAGTKNAIDYLYNEIQGKPALVISYGIKGGTIANESLKTTLEGMKLPVVKTRPALPFKEGDLFPAVAGTLGEGTTGLWDEEYKETLLGAYGELRESVREVAEKKAKEAEEAAKKTVEEEKKE